jgi:uncharacterized phage protein gp47/JayE
MISAGFSDAAYEGTAVRSVVESVDLHIANLYNDMNGNLSGSYLSQASGATLVAIALLVGVTPRNGESDNDLRYRTSVAINSKAGANLTELTVALLALSGISTVLPIPFSQGLGTMSFYLIATNGIADSSTVALAQATVNNLAAAGTTTFVLTPTPLTVSITGTISVSSSSNRSSVAASVSAAIANYISNLSMGNPLVVNELITAALNVAGTTDFNLLTILTTDQNGNSVEQIIRNYTPQFDQQLIPGTIAIS